MGGKRAVLPPTASQNSAYITDCSAPCVQNGHSLKGKIVQ